MIWLQRREFITLLGGAVAAWPLAARAQQADRVRRIGVLMQFPETDPVGQQQLQVLREMLQKLGWRIGSNLQLDYRWNISNDERARAGTAELLKLQPDLILANGTVSLSAARQATHTVPIVFTTVTDPIGQGFVASLANPGGNITGFSFLEPSLGGKWLGLLRDIAPHVSRIVFLFNPARGPYSASKSPLAGHAVAAAGQSRAKCLREF